MRLFKKGDIVAYTKTKDFEILMEVLEDQELENDSFRAIIISDERYDLEHGSPNNWNANEFTVVIPLFDLEKEVLVLNHKLNLLEFKYTL